VVVEIIVATATMTGDGTTVMRRRIPGASEKDHAPEHDPERLIAGQCTCQ
jgi:hypothetical protein